MPLSKLSRVALLVQGQVQGVGFRPFVWRLANEDRLAGMVANTSAGVRIEIQGEQEAIGRFRARLLAELPPLAKITSLTSEACQIEPNATVFEIKSSEEHGGQNVLISADVAICEDCLEDMRDPANRRFGYAFTNCTNCGPRFSITRHIPYDRATTTMGCFALCPSCAAEYSNPADRRFHAQPVACADCGPALWFVSKNQPATGPTAANQANAIARAGQLLQNGGILALRGLGGFQLVCDARNIEAVQNLRKRKNRPHKALAIMGPDLDAIREICTITPEEEKLLTGQRKPIVLCKATSTHFGHIAPDTADLGVMLPYTPLHAQLFDWLAENSAQPPILVMTSANPQGEPICLGNREALARLENLADGFLLHNRDILCRVDDSVVMGGNLPVILRRARGYTPEPVSLDITGLPVMGAGAELKATFCLTRNNQAFPGQHIGDLQNPANMEFYEQSLAHLQNLLEITPRAIVHDLHPDFLSTRFAQSLARKLEIPAIQLQHHAAHAAACLAEHNYFQPALALCLDGTGLGADGNIWGGELLQVDLREPSWIRLGHLKPFFMPGGTAAIEEPWRLAKALRYELNELDSNREDKIIAELLQKKINSPLTTSCGRLFDAVSAELDLCKKITYEGQAALRLEQAARQWLAAHSMPTPYWPRPDLVTGSDASWQLDTLQLFDFILAEKGNARPVGEIAAIFHYTLALGFAALAYKTSLKSGIKTIALSGGVMQNALFADILRQALVEADFTVLEHRQVPPGDGGLSLGQAVWGLQLLKNA